MFWCRVGSGVVVIGGPLAICIDKVFFCLGRGGGVVGRVFWESFSGRSDLELLGGS